MRPVELTLETIAINEIDGRVASESVAPPTCNWAKSAKVMCKGVEGGLTLRVNVFLTQDRCPHVHDGTCDHT